MYLDSNLKIEIISSLLGQTIKPYDRKRRGRTEDILSVDDFHLHNLIGKRKAVKEPFIKEEDFFDPEYDCDFTNLSDTAECSRGDELYERPKGWYRMALKVNGKYEDGDTWLGAKRWRNHSVPGEWPVSYHGTSLNGVKGIIRSHYSAGDRAMYGRGIYSTPDIHVAEREEYAKTFTSKTTGKSYKVILQNRINPKKREICTRFDYWLIRVNDGTSASEERKIVEGSIRPYGILIKEVNDEADGDIWGNYHGHKDDGGHDGDDNDSDDDGKYDDGSVTCDSYNDDDDNSIDDHDDDDGGKYDDASVDDISDNDDGGDNGDGDDDESDDDGTVDEDYNDNGEDDDNEEYDDDDNVDDMSDNDDDGGENCDGDDGESDDDGNVDDDDNIEDDDGTDGCDDDAVKYDDDNNVDDTCDDDDDENDDGDEDYNDNGEDDDNEYDDDNNGEYDDDGNVDDICDDDGADGYNDDNNDYDDDYNDDYDDDYDD